MVDDARRASTTAYVASRNRLCGDDFSKGFDAINKDMRRNPDRWKDGPDGRLRRESSIFESVEFI